MIVVGWMYFALLILSVVLNIVAEDKAPYQRLISVIIQFSLACWIFRAMEVLK